MLRFGKLFWAIVSMAVGFVAVTLITTNIENWSEETGINKLWKMIIPVAIVAFLKALLPYLAGFGLGAAVFGLWEKFPIWWKAYREKTVGVTNLVTRETELSSAETRLRECERTLDRLSNEITEAIRTDQSDLIISTLIQQWEAALAGVDNTAIRAFPDMPNPDVLLGILYLPSQSPLPLPARFNAEQGRAIRRFWDQRFRLPYILPELDRRIHAALDSVRTQLRKQGVKR